MYSRVSQISSENFILNSVGDIFLNYLPHFQGLDQIPSRSVGYILRILGQNPTEDDIVEMVMKVRLIIILLMYSSVLAVLSAKERRG